MPSLFGRVSENVVKEVGCKETRPVKHLSSANKFHLFSILRKKTSVSLTRQSEYVPLGSTLMDILQSPSVPVTNVVGPLCLEDITCWKHKASVDVNVGAEMSVSGECSEDHGHSLEYQIVSISPPNLEDLLKRKLVDPEPQYLSECRDRNDKLYVVTQTIELIKDTVLYDSNNTNFLGKIFLGITSGKSQGEGQHLKMNMKKLSLQKGMVMAYKMQQLVIKEKGIVSTSSGGEQTFQDEDSSQSESESESDSGNYMDFEDLQNKLSLKMDALGGLSKNIQHVVFHSVLAMLRDQRALENMLEFNSLCYLDDPLCNILNELQQNSSPAEHAILDLLEGVIEFLSQGVSWFLVGVKSGLFLTVFPHIPPPPELNDVQHYFLALSMEKRILGQQRELARSILEPHFEYMGVVTFTLNPELQAPLQKEDLAITCNLLEECGLKIELNSPRSYWYPSAKMSLSILYGVLSLLQELAEASALPEGPSVQRCLAFSQAMLNQTHPHCPSFSVTFPFEKRPESSGYITGSQNLNLTQYQGLPRDSSFSNDHMLTPMVRGYAQHQNEPAGCWYPEMNNRDKVSTLMESEEVALDKAMKEHHLQATISILRELAVPKVGKGRRGGGRAHAKPYRGKKIGIFEERF
ncbi:gasdermin-C [Nycticebus coucang]|uniref:gasdermin-C n=1 Tax=Nycticebus coucang TaxID=9470 RepID=UPI00234CB7DB|nr:gasdermin-C [Nycticebus coucang]